ncbi:MAG: MBL fold metallo-hydrolase [Candidatus Micrarchaeota archaeon]
MANTFTYQGVKITLFGHASVCFEAQDKVVYVDPYVLGPGAKRADVVLHTHPHHDHCVLPNSILQPSTTVLGKGCKHPGRSLSIGDKVQLASNIVLEVVDAYNLEKPFHPRSAGAGFIFTFGSPGREVRVYVAGDTDRIPEMKNYRCDIAFLPVGGTWTMDVREAVGAVMDIRPKIAIPYHCNYVDGTPADLARFKEAVEGLNIAASVRILTT